MRLVPLATASLLMLLSSLAACVSMPNPRQELAQRLTAALERQIAGKEASVQQTASGARVLLSNSSLFKGATTQLDERGPLVLARVVQGMFDPQKTRIEISATSDAATSDGENDAAAGSRNIMAYFESVGFSRNSLVQSSPAAGLGRTALDIQLTM